MSDQTTPEPTKRARLLKIAESSSVTKLLVVGCMLFLERNTARIEKKVEAEAQSVTAEAKGSDADLRTEISLLKSKVQVVAYDLAAQGIDVAVIKETTNDLAAKVPAELGKLRKRVERNEAFIARLRAEQH